MGDMSQWLSENWFNILTLFFGSGVWFAAYSIRMDTEVRREDAKTRKAANLLAITANHREIWKEFLNNAELGRIQNTGADIVNEPVTEAEHVFVTLVILHTNNVYYVMKDELVPEYEGAKKDIEQFFSLPVPKAVWRESKLFQNREFVAFIDKSLN
jgi:hypothetical protein